MHGVRSKPPSRGMKSFGPGIGVRNLQPNPPLLHHICCPLRPDWPVLELLLSVYARWAAYPCEPPSPHHLQELVTGCPSGSSPFMPSSFPGKGEPLSFPIWLDAPLLSNTPSSFWTPPFSDYWCGVLLDPPGSGCYSSSYLLSSISGPSSLCMTGIV